MLKKRLILLGGGHTHALLLKSLMMKPFSDTEILLISPQTMTPYSGMLPGYIAGNYSFDEMHFDLLTLCEASGVRLILDSVIRIDSAATTLHFQSRPTLPYDLLSINIGSVPDREEFGIAVKPMANFLQSWDDLTTARSIAVVGGGAGGVELALSLQHRFGDKCSLSIIQRDKNLLPKAPRAIQKRFKEICAQRGIRVHLGVQDSAALTHTVDKVIWATSAKGPKLLADSNLSLDENGFLITDQTLLCKGRSDIFAAGDCAVIEGQPRPRSGVYAVRLAMPLRKNLELRLLGLPLQEVKLQKQQLSLITTGDREAIAVRGRFYWQSWWLWPLKNWIDRRFMAKFKNLKVMPMKSASPADAMRCLGCGAKVEGAVLKRVLRRLAQVFPSVFDKDLSLAMNDDVSIVAMNGLVMQSLDYFPAFLSDPFIFGQIACLHAASDLLAKGGKPQSCLALAVLPYQAPVLMEDEQFQMLAGVAQVLQSFDAKLLGGHSAEGMQLAVGLMMQGQMPAINTWRPKGGLQVGDVLVLTKALGTGIILAAKMKGLCKGPWFESCVASMLQNQVSLLPLITQDGVHGSTDITGFGFLGHLAEMVTASSVTVAINAAALPWLAGVKELVGLGIQSTLFAGNVSYAHELCRIEMEESGLSSAMFDPQSSGPLLLSLAPEIAEAWLSEAHRLGFESICKVGTVVKKAEASITIT